MTTAQWLWEFEALVQKEKNDVERQLEFFKLIKRQVIGMLGLNLICKKEDLEKNPEIFIPWAILGGRREVVQEIFDHMEKETNIKSVTQDEEFEKLSSAIASGDIGDMDPILDISDLKLDEIKKSAQEEDLKKAGIKLVDKIEPSIHISFDKSKTWEKTKEGIKDIQAARQQVDKELESERKQVHGLSVLFDDDA